LLASEYVHWVERAALCTEGALGLEQSTPSRTVITEDYVRASILRGLALSFPRGADRVLRESSVGWDAADCVGGHAINGAGRPLQHDAAVAPEPGYASDAGMALEVKWLTRTSPKSVAQDVWKLALSRSNTAELSALRTYLAVGGTMSDLSSTLTGLRNIGLDLRWSAAGAGADRPRPTTLDLSRTVATPMGAAALRELLKRGQHFRNPPACWQKLRASLRWRWVSRVETLRESDAVAWRIVVWELDHRTMGNSLIDWSSVMPEKGIVCPGTA